MAKRTTLASSSRNPAYTQIDISVWYSGLRPVSATNAYRPDAMSK